ncbi:MAG: hypothetical protein U1F43_11205 [Myxococcota bacterium]
MRRAACVCVAALSWLGCGDPPLDAIPDGDTPLDTANGETDASEPDAAVDPEPAVAAWLGTREIGGIDNDSLYGAVAMPGGDVVVFGAAATPGQGAEGSRWIVHRLSPSGATRWSAGGLTGAALRGTPGPDDSVIVVGQYNVARYDADGSERWHALDDLWVTDVGVDLEGRVVVGGLYAGGPFRPAPTLRPPIGATGGTYDGFVIRLDADDGHVLDQVQVGTAVGDWVNGLAVGPEGGVYLTGPTEGTFPKASHVGTDGNSYVMRLTPELTLDWATQLSDGFDQGYAIRFDGYTNQLAVLTGHGAGLTRVDAVTGDFITSLYVADVAGSDLAIDAQSRVWFVGSTHEGPAFGLVTIIDPDDHVAPPLWLTDSPAQGISTLPSLYGSSGAHAFGVALDGDGFAWVAGDAMGDLEQGRNAATRSAANAVDPGGDGIVARVTPELRRDRPRFILDPLPPMSVGQSATLALRLEDGSGQPLTAPPQSLAWSSALPEVATVSSAGVVTARSGGRTRIQVALGPAHSEPLEVVVKDPSHPELGSVVLIGADHADIATVVVADAYAGGGADPGALLVGGWSDGPLAHGAAVPAELADYDVMHGQRDAFIAEVAGDGSIRRLLQLGGAVYDGIQQIVPLPDGSLLVRADLSAPRGINFPRPLIARIERDGSERWHFPDQWTAEQSFTIHSMSLMANGHILLGGDNNSLLLAELDPDTGLELWRWVAEGHVQGGAGGVVMRAAGVRPDGTYVVIGDDAPAWRTWTLGLDPAQTEPIFGGPKILFYANTAPQVGILPGPLVVAPAGPASGAYATASTSGTSFNQDGSDLVRSLGASVIYFAADGTPEWNTSPEVDGEQTIAGLVIDAAGNTYVAGPRGELGADTVAAQASQFDAFLAKLDPDGHTVWVRRVGGPANDFGEAVAVTAGGDLALVGYTFGAIDGTALHGDPGKESCDAFLARFSPDGERR